MSPAATGCTLTASFGTSSAISQPFDIKTPDGTLVCGTGIGVSIDTAPYTLVGDTAHAQLAATAADPYPVDSDGDITFLKLADPGVFIGGITFDGPMTVVPDAPGLGIDADWAKLAKIATERSGAA